MDNKPKQTEPVGNTESLYTNSTSRSTVIGRVCNKKCVPEHNCKYKEAWERLEKYLNAQVFDFIKDKVSEIKKELDL